MVSPAWLAAGQVNAPWWLVTWSRLHHRNRHFHTYLSIYFLPITNTTGGHFACACVNPPNDNSVGASHLMAGNRKLARKVTVLLKTISLVLWIPHFPTKNILHDKNQTFSTRVFTCRFFSSRFSWPFKDFQDSTPKRSLISTGKAMHFYGLISKHVVLHIREEMHRSNFQLVSDKKWKKIYPARFIY